MNTQTIINCPACGGENPESAVFCGNPECHKALGEFRYVLEEVAASSSWIERLADKINNFSGHPHFITVHVAWFVVWVMINSGLVAAISVFDAYPYGLLSILLAVEAILITGFILISNNRQNAHANKRAALDYEVNVRTFRKIGELQKSLEELEKRLQNS